MVAFYIFGAYTQQFGLEVINTVERTEFRVRKETNSLQELKTLLDLVTNPCMFKKPWKGLFRNTLPSTLKT